jgi:hypothetical protein
MIAALLACSACGGGDQDDPVAAPPAEGAAVTGAAVATTAPAGPATVNLDEGGGGGGEGNKWRDSGVYVDGKPVGVLWFGELPVALKPVWIDGYEMLEFGPGDKGPRERKIKVRRYRIAEYLEAVGVDLRRVKEVHLYAPSGYPGIVTGRELRRVRKTLLFAFGRETTGKPLIYFPAGMKINTTFDHIGAIAVYVDKKPPTLTEDQDLVVDGRSVYGEIPYFGEPLRGGIRIYKDDRLAATIKRRKLQESLDLATRGDDGELRWNLFQFLEARGVGTADVVAAETVERDLRTARLGREQLAGTWFTAHPSASGQILVGASRQPVEALMLYTRPLPPPAK